MKIDPLAIKVAARLRAVMQEYGLSTAADLAAACGAERSAASNWLQGYNLPPVRHIIELATKTGITLDWIYAGKVETLPGGLAIRLAAIMDGHPLQTRLPEPEGSPAEEDGPAPKGAARRAGRLRREPAT